MNELRSHDPHPTLQERGWIAFDDVGAIARAVLLAAVALAIGWGASTLLEAQNRDLVATFAYR
jgi:hypothetical protein